jgi:hypothetical protein
VLVRYTQDAQSIQRHIDRNKTLANHVNTGRMGDMAHAASIPIGVMYEWKSNITWTPGIFELRRDQAEGQRAPELQ